MEEDEAHTPPFWLQNSGKPRRSRLDLSSFLPSSGVLFLLFLATSIAFVLVDVPPVRRVTSQIFRPHSVKKSWDSLNLVLFLFAILCGFRSRSNHGEDGGSSCSCSWSDSRKSSSSPSSSSNPVMPYKWCDSYDRRSPDWREYGFCSTSFRRMRSSRSYPHRRAQESPWTYGEAPRRFHDDTHVVWGRDFVSAPVYSRRKWNEEEHEEEKKFETKRVVVDDSRDPNAAVEEKEVPVTPPPSAPQPPQPPLPETPPPPPRAQVAGNKPKPKRTYETVAHKPKNERDKPEAAPPPLPAFHPMEEKIGEKRDGSATKEFLNSLKMKKKRRGQKSIENFESFLASQQLPSSSRLRAPPRPSPPPQPPPPPSVFHALFPSKKSKTRKALPASPPPRPVPPAPTAQPKTRATPPAFSQSTANSITVNEPRTPVTTTLNYESPDDSINSGSQSTLIPIPPPPLPPPAFHSMVEKIGKKRGGSATKEFLNSLKMKRKRQRQKSIENFESFLAYQELPSSSRLTPPPPPSVFHALFPSKKSKTRKTLPASPPPPPVPPAPTAQRKTRATPPVFSQSTANSITDNKPRTPLTTTLNYKSPDDSTNSGSQSWLIPLPPPPPFNVPPWRFVHDDYLRVKSMTTWRHGTPDTEDEEGDDEASVSGTTESPSNASSEATSPGFCPSPDVDTKAGNFIARFRAGLILEKVKTHRRFNLAPEMTLKHSPICEN